MFPYLDLDSQGDPPGQTPADPGLLSPQFLLRVWPILRHQSSLHWSRWEHLWPAPDGDSVLVRVLQMATRVQHLLSSLDQQSVCACGLYSFKLSCAAITNPAMNAAHAAFASPALQ
eukprot:272985-Pelagomonas_calceolata.AAC.1